MKLKAFLLSLVISVGSFSYAENHVVSPEFQQDFKIAVKKIEDKKFLEGDFTTKFMDTFEIK